MSFCRSCSAEIVWASTKAGKSMPLDAAPHPDGNVEAVLTDGRWHVVAVHTTPDLFGGIRYHSHFTTCPNAAEHRKTR